MNINDICEKAMSKHGLNQRELATRLGINESAVSNARAGRRGLPEDAIEILSSMTGVGQWEIYKAGKAKARKGDRAETVAAWLIAVFGVTLFVTHLSEVRAQSGAQANDDRGLQIMRNRRGIKWARARKAGLVRNRIQAWIARFGSQGLPSSV